jgi:transcription initiation factor TFIIIB Brf1 subunit/transcription initiation factor TFIIB
MKEFLLNNFEGLAILLGALILFLQREKNYRQRKEESKKRDKDSKKRDKGLRREFLVKMMTDEKMPLSTRQKAAVEYMDEGYNGTMRDYIVENRLYIK